ncbi:MAG: DUF6110 family protein [Eubacteriales bacterium]|nr:DUF6110 family protein [Eubacteriales bacterium]
MSNSHFPKYIIGFAVGMVAAPVLKSGIARKAFTYLTAGGFIAKDGIMEAVENIQTCAMDISEDAKVITEKYYEKQDKKYDEEVSEEENIVEEEEA